MIEKNDIHKQDEDDVEKIGLVGTFCRDLRTTKEIRLNAQLAEKDLDHIMTTHSRIDRDIQKLTAEFVEINSRNVKYKAFMKLNRNFITIDNNVQEHQNLKEPKVLIAESSWNDLRQDLTRGMHLKCETMTFNKRMKCLERFNASRTLICTVNKFMWQTITSCNGWNHELVHVIGLLKEKKNERQRNAMVVMCSIQPMR